MGYRLYLHRRYTNPDPDAYTNPDSNTYTNSDPNPSSNPNTGHHTANCVYHRTFQRSDYFRNYYSVSDSSGCWRRGRCAVQIRWSNAWRRRYDCCLFDLLGHDASCERYPCHNSGGQRLS